MGVVVRAAQLIPLLLKFGFRIVRQTGSHVQLRHISDITKRVTVPVHNKDLPIKTLKSILNQAGITMEQFLKSIGR